MRKSSNLLILLVIFLNSIAYGSFKSVPFTRKEISVLAKDVQVKKWNWQSKNQLFSNEKLRKIPNMIKLNVTKPIILKHAQYKHFYSNQSINSAVRFHAKWRTLLKRAPQKHRVDPETIVSVMLVETRFGRHTGKYPVLAVFASTYVDAKALLAKGGLSAKMTKRVRRKMNWALGELQSLLKMKSIHGTDILTLKGSYAGAFGLCQFLPSSFISYAAKGVGKGRPNLHWEPDAIFSVARYLSTHGYRQGSRFQTKRNRRAIRRYNNSDVYVDTVLGVAANVRKTLP